eukprot:6193847-Pyramimonas_sp.AAC.1
MHQFPKLRPAAASRGTPEGQLPTTKQVDVFDSVFQTSPRAGYQAITGDRLSHIPRPKAAPRLKSCAAPERWRGQGRRQLASGSSSSSSSSLPPLLA